MQTNPVGSSEPSVVVQGFLDVSKLLKEAKEAPSLETKRALYEKIFEKIDINDPSTLGIFFEQFAAEALYNQTIDSDPKKGFLLSAYLMEFSLLLQLKGLNLIDSEAFISSTDPIFKIKSLNEFVSALGDMPILDKLFTSYSFDLQAMVVAAQDQKLIGALANTLKRLSFSYQNSPNHQTDLKLQEHVQLWTEKAIGEDLVTRIDYQYNRALFMLNLRNPAATISEKVNAYQIIKEELNMLDPSDRFRLEKHSQIANMQAIVYVRANENLIQAKIMSSEAVKMRESLYEAATSEADRYQQAYFLANALTVRIQCIKVLGATDDDKIDLLRYLKLLESRLSEMDARGDKNTYRDFYVSAVAKIKEILSLG